MLDEANNSTTFADVAGYSHLVTRFQAQFRLVKPIKPKASRDKSSETFLVGMGLKSR